MEKNITEAEEEIERYAKIKEISKEPTNPPKVWTFKKRKCLNDVDEELCQVALQKLQEEPDNYDKFGQYIALQLRSLKSDFNKVRMRSEIKFIFKYTIYIYTYLVSCTTNK